MDAISRTIRAKAKRIPPLNDEWGHSFSGCGGTLFSRKDWRWTGKRSKLGFGSRTTSQAVHMVYGPKRAFLERLVVKVAAIEVNALSGEVPRAGRNRAGLTYAAARLGRRFEYYPLRQCAFREAPSQTFLRFVVYIHIFERCTVFLCRCTNLSKGSTSAPTKLGLFICPAQLDPNRA
jgi:hypothetical protein